MKAPQSGLAALARVMDGDELTTANLRDVGSRVVSERDVRILDAFYVEYGGDQRAVPSTPAWMGLFGQRTGQLALVHDRLVFFYETLFNDECRHAFSLSRGSYDVRWRKTGCTISAAGESYRISFDPPRGVNLTEVSGPAENPKVSDWVDLVAGGGGTFLELLGGVSEMASMWRSNKIAKVHCALWRAMIAQVDAGRTWPFTPEPSLFDAPVVTGTSTSRPATPAPQANKRRSPPASPGRGRKATRRSPTPRKVTLRTTSGGALRLHPGSMLLLERWLTNDGSDVASGQAVAVGELRNGDGTTEQVTLTAPYAGLLRQRVRPSTLSTARHVLGRLE